MKFFLLVLLILSSSCSSLGEWRQWKDNFTKDVKNDPLVIYRDKDYIDQLSFLGGEYLATPGIRAVKLSGSSLRYLKRIYSRIVRNSELILDKTSEPKFYFVKQKTPFYFSLPDSQFFFSSGLVKNFLKNEQLLVAVLAHEIVKSQKLIYMKKAVVPLGFINTERMIALTKVPMNIKMEINKWTFYVLKRAGYDSSAYLNWLQTQNKNTLDFTFQLGTSKQISKEEFLFKNFIVKQGIIDDSYNSAGPSNSSREFYRLINEMGGARI